MHRRSEFRILSVAVLMVFAACLASAHEVTITSQSKLGSGPMLKPDTYRLELVKNSDSSEVLFYKGAKLVLRTPVSLAEETVKPKMTEVHCEDLDAKRVITRIRVQGWKESLVFK
jgi:hypothetical protein